MFTQNLEDPLYTGASVVYSQDKSPLLGEAVAFFLGSRSENDELPRRRAFFKHRLRLRGYADGESIIAARR